MFLLLQTYKPRWGYKRANDDTKEWVIEVPGNVTLHFTHFDMGEGRNARYDHVAIYQGAVKIGQWDCKSKPPSVLTLQGSIKIVFQSGGAYYRKSRGDGFEIYVDNGDSS